MNILLNPSQWPWEAWIGAAIVCLIVGIVISNAVKAGAAKTGVAAKSAEASVVAHVKAAVAKHPHVPAPDPAVVQAVSAAPAADAKIPPPVGASPPSAVSGGPDVTKKHAAIEAEIAAHSSAIEGLLARKAALEKAQADANAANARLAQLTEGA